MLEYINERMAGRLLHMADTKVLSKKELEALEKKNFCQRVNFCIVRGLMKPTLGLIWNKRVKKTEKIKEEHVYKAMHIPRSDFSQVCSGRKNITDKTIEKNITGGQAGREHIIVSIFKGNDTDLSIEIENDEAFWKRYFGEKNNEKKASMEKELESKYVEYVNKYITKKEALELSHVRDVIEWILIKIDSTSDQSSRKLNAALIELKKITVENLETCSINNLNTFNTWLKEYQRRTEAVLNYRKIKGEKVVTSDKPK